MLMALFFSVLANLLFNPSSIICFCLSFCCSSSYKFVYIFFFLLIPPLALCISSESINNYLHTFFWKIKQLYAFSLRIDFIQIGCLFFSVIFQYRFYASNNINLYIDYLAGNYFIDCFPIAYLKNKYESSRVQLYVSSLLPKLFFLP